MMKNKNKNEFYPAALTIAGSDSGGGAGIQADLRTFNAFGVFGCTAITAVTAQNPREVRRIDPIPAEGVRAQIDAVTAAVAIRFAKSGMLAEAAIVETVADAVETYRLKLIADPVMVSTSGAPLLAPGAIEAVRLLLKRALWITPNLPEAELLLGRKLRNERDYREAALACHEMFGASLLLKTGHAPAGKFAVDYVCCDRALYALSSPRLPSVRGVSHGTGCTLSAALTAALAMGMPWKQALCEAKAFVLGSLQETVQIGSNLSAMYPPVEDHLNSVRLERL